MRAFLHGISLCVIVLAGGGLVACGNDIQATEPDVGAFSDVGPFAQRIDEYLAMADAARTRAAKPTFRGKVIFVNTKERRVDFRFIEPLIESKSPLLAYAPDQVGAVVLVRPRLEEVGLYAGGGKAYVVHATMTVVDVVQGKAIAEKTFVSGPPPSSATMGWDAEGPLPAKEILAWVEGMARQ